MLSRQIETSSQDNSKVQLDLNAYVRMKRQLNYFTEWRINYCIICKFGEGLNSDVTGQSHSLKLSFEKCLKGFSKTAVKYFFLAELTHFSPMFHI